MKLNFLKPKRIFLLGIFSASIVLSPLSSLALKVEEVPNPRQVSGGWVTDLADILSADTKAQINQMIADLEAKNGTEIAVVTVPTTSPAPSPKSFATELFNHWGIGKQGEDNGVLFLISVGDRRVEIETGYGVEAILPDAKVGNIINSKITPRFKQGDFSGGTLAGTKALIVVLGSDSQPPGLFTRVIQSTIDRFGVSSDLLVFLLLVGITEASVIGLFFFNRFIYERSRRTLLHPEDRTRRKEGYYVFCCIECKKRMKNIDFKSVAPHLNVKEQTALKLGSVKFEGWQCLTCSQQSTGRGFHLIGLESTLYKFDICPHCKEYTVTRTDKILNRATRSRGGKKLVMHKCHHCNYYQETEKTIPRLPPPSSSSGGGYGGGGYSGGGGFGGGSSGGGGAGGDF
ncbi:MULTISPECIES: TPM domain-containing protein [unclassified Nodularia (in: cyanobacteria)]|uniref:TPM domain-containing protein n=1 Tax=unclassified Nodularia (in: cyanobacteria) TaxID=2656917 RepID=UPI0018812580|nr:MULTISPECIES: TPM domain-containing protein [unclassified Nodularia (in: cyanobacteria)]MBE9197811.1 TPM domain-containing protein [Nodularia sp. LEGE 06071]MCC2695072.1 TPM domain-containing protein [Nodularia sp. LEGE 04288]